MRKYRATVQVTGIAGENPRAVRSALDEQLRNSGLQNCKVVSIDIDAPRRPDRRSTEVIAAESPAEQIGRGGLLLAAAAAWAILFFWWVLSVSPPD